MRKIMQIAKHLIKSHDAVYSRAYYESDVDKSATASASVIATSIVKTLGPKKVIDVGCGTGALLVAFRDLDCEVSVSDSK